MYMSKSLRLSKQSILTLADENENQSQAISYLKQEKKEMDRIIRQFNASLADGAEDSFTFREDYLQLSNTVNKTLENSKWWSLNHNQVINTPYDLLSII